MESIAASSDRVVIHQALKHLVVAGNALIYMGKDGLKMYPLNRYVMDKMEWQCNGDCHQGTYQP